MDFCEIFWCELKLHLLHLVDFSATMTMVLFHYLAAAAAAELVSCIVTS